MSSEQQDNVRAKLEGQHPLAEKGLWQIYGEDPNCDLGGSHHQPLLGTVEGTYAAAVDYALELPGFFTWGGGGDVRKMEVLQVNERTRQERIVLRAKQKLLKAQLAEVDAELKKLGG